MNLGYLLLLLAAIFQISVIVRSVRCHQCRSDKQVYCENLNGSEAYLSECENPPNTKRNRKPFCRKIVQKLHYSSELNESTTIRECAYIHFQEDTCHNSQTETGTVALCECGGSACNKVYFFQRRLPPWNMFICIVLLRTFFTL